MAYPAGIPIFGGTPKKEAPTPAAVPNKLPIAMSYYFNVRQKYNIKKQKANYLELF